MVQKVSIRRTKKKFINGRISLPMYKPVQYQKQKVDERIKKGELTLGEEVVALEYSRYKIDRETNTIVLENDRVCMC